MANNCIHVQFNCRDLAFGRGNLRRVVPRRKGASDMTAGSKTILKAVLLISASVGLSGCVYDLGLGYASDGYYDDGYGCDPYGGYDAYYDCDYGQGFANIGFGGGYYDNYFYPGYGFFLFDNVGRRYPMRDHHRRYWGEKRQGYFREQRGRDRGGRRHNGRPHGYSSDATPGVYGSAERNTRRAPNPEDLERTGRGRDREDGVSRRERRNDRALNAGQTRQTQRTQQEGSQAAVPAPRAAPAPRPEPTPPIVRRGRDEGVNVRDQ